MKKTFLSIVLLLGVLSSGLQAQEEVLSYWQQYGTPAVQKGKERARRPYKWVKEHPKETVASVALAAGLIATAKPAYRFYLQKKFEKARTDFENQYKSQSWFEDWMPEAAAGMKVLGVANYLKTLSYNDFIQIDRDLQGKAAENFRKFIPITDQQITKIFDDETERRLPPLDPEESSITSMEEMD